MVQLTWQAAWLFLWTCCSIFLLILFGETPQGIALMGLSVIGVFVSWCGWRREKEPHENTWWLFWGSYLGLSCLSVLVSESWLQTLNKILIAGFSFGVVSTWWLVDKKWLNVRLFGIGLLLLGMVLACMVALLFVMPELVALLPAMNLLVATYGHNHANIIFVLCVPLAWQFWMEKKYAAWAWLPLGVIVGGVLLSFGRVAVVITLAQLGWLSYQAFSGKKWPRLLVGSLGGLLVALAFFGILSLWPGVTDPSQCMLPVLKTQLCKVLRTEGRPAYWRLALEGVAARPLSGWGVGNFPAAAKRLQHEMSEYSAYAHNEFLQWLVEYGAIGGIWLIGCWGYLAFWVWRVSRQEARHQPWVKVMSLGVFGMWFDALFNYNWSYVSVWTLMMILMTIILRSQRTARGTLLLPRHRAIIRVCVGSVVLGVFAWGVAYVFSTWWWSQKAYDQALIRYPFVYWRVEDALMNKVLVQPHTRELLIQWYWGNEQMIRAATLGTDDQLELERLYERLVVLQPSELFNSVKLWRLALERQDGPKMVSIATKLEKNVTDDMWGDVINRDSLLIADTVEWLKVSADSDPVNSARLFGLIVRHRPWEILNESSSLSVFSHPEQFPPSTVELFLDAWGTSQLWPYDQTLADWWEGRLRRAIQIRDWATATAILQKYYQYLPNSTYRIWNLATDEYVVQFKKAATPAERLTVLNKWFDAFQIITGLHQTGSPKATIEMASRQKLAVALIAEGRARSQTQPAEAGALYQSASQVDFFVFAPAMMSFMEKPQEWPAVESFFDKVVQINDAGLFPSHPLSVIFLQRAADLLSARGNSTETEWFLRQLQVILPQNAWTSAQLGNYWYASAERIKNQDWKRAEVLWMNARDEYQRCLSTFSDPQQTQCYWGLQSLDKGWHDGEAKYQQARREILRSFAVSPTP